ncbi:MAG: hypothetical protein HW421_179 [Ignavibacteria bacterium]|nr:hypothetical protein [Ignavibacteria bacterium]
MNFGQDKRRDSNRVNNRPGYFKLDVDKQIKLEHIVSTSTTNQINKVLKEWIDEKEVNKINNLKALIEEYRKKAKS